MQPTGVFIETIPTDEQRLIVYVRTVLCGTECFPAYEIDTLVRRFKCSVSAAQDGRMTTWTPKNSVPVLIAGTGTLGNIVILCRSGQAFSMSRGLQVPPLSKGVVLVGNCTLNHDDTFRLLLYDGENLPCRGVSNVAPTPTERYERLRDFFPQYFECSDSARNTFVLQWVGFYEHAVKFLDGSINVGHNIGGLVSITSDAMTPTRPVKVQIPNIVIQRFQEKK
jgi:hypothetical protein